MKPADSSEEKVGSLYVPDTAREKPQEGTIVAVGTGKVNAEGKKIEFQVAVGDLVLYGKYGGTEVKVGNEEYLMMRESDILAVVS